MENPAIIGAQRQKSRGTDSRQSLDAPTCAE